MQSVNKATYFKLTKHDRQRVNSLSKFVAEQVIPINPEGFSLDVFTFKAPVFDEELLPSIYFVSVYGHEQIYPKIPTYEEIYAWLENNYELLSIYGNFVGFWKHLGQFYLDITNAILGRQYAFIFAQQNKQIEIYHLASQKSIPVPMVMPCAPVAPDKERKIA